MAFAPGGALAGQFGFDEDISSPDCLRVEDLINPEKGLVTVIEADGLDNTNRKFILGTVLMATWRWAQSRGEGSCDQGGHGPGTFIVLEEAHELFGAQEGEDRDAAATRVALYESLFRRSRQYGLKLIAAVQNPSQIPDSVLGNVGLVISHQLSGDNDKQAMSGLFNWIAALGQNYREFRYLGEMAVGDCIVRMKSKNHYLQASPVHIRVDPAALPEVDDAWLARRASRKAVAAPSS
jgi:hypothetical protein